MKQQLLKKTFAGLSLLMLVPVFTYAQEPKIDLVNSNQTGIKIDAENFPNQKFRDYLSSQDYGKDGVITEEEIDTITSMDVSNLGISALTGIAKFTALTELDCSGNNLTAFNIPGNTVLKTLNCSNNKIAKLFVNENIALETLNCSGNELEALGLNSNTDLKTLDCSGNDLKSLNLSKNTKLTTLNCSDNENLSSLGLGSNPELKELNCSNCGLTSLYLTNNLSLVTLDCSKNNFEKGLSVAANTKLQTLNCSDCGLTGLNVNYNTELITLNCSGNKYESQRLSFPYNEKLKDLNVSNMGLTNLFVNNNPDLETLNCSGNELIALGLRSNINQTTLNCSNNDLQSLNVNYNTKLTTLICSDNENLTSLSLSLNKSLKTLDCSNCGLSNLNVNSNTELETLNCSGNSFETTTLSFPKNTELKDLNCSNNNLTVLDVTANDKLETLDCSNNNILYLNFQDNASSIKEIYCYKNNLNGANAYAFVAPILNNKDVKIYFRVADDTNATSVELASAANFYESTNGTTWETRYNGEGEAPKVEVSVNSYGYSTFCPMASVDFSGAETIAAYRAKVDGTILTLTKADKVYAGEGVLLFNFTDNETKTAKESFPYCAEFATPDNDFEGIKENGINKPIVLEGYEDDVTNYVLAAQNGNIGFYIANKTNVAVGKAYLPVKNAQVATAGLRLVFDDNATAIDDVPVTIQDSEDDAIYTLNGVRVKNPTEKGIYIRNGKKVVIK